MLIGLHHVILLSGMILSQIADEYCMYSYVNIGTAVMAILNLIALYSIEDPPYFQLIFYKNLLMSESDCQFIDKSSNSCHDVKKIQYITKYCGLCGSLWYCIINKCTYIYYFRF